MKRSIVKSAKHALRMFRLHRDVHRRPLPECVARFFGDWRLTYRLTRYHCQ